MKLEHLIALLIVACVVIMIAIPDLRIPAFGFFSVGVGGALVAAFTRKATQEAAREAGREAAADTYVRLSRRPASEERSPLVREARTRMPMESATGFEVAAPVDEEAEFQTARRRARGEEEP